jgi:glycerol-3-phosphate acyltransferase PlsY
MEELLEIAGTAIAAFLIGSFPTAYLLVRKNSGKDLRGEGSGNIGTLNAYEVTRSRKLGLGVLLIDLIKGALPVGVVFLSGGTFTLGVTALLGVVIGHNYSPWIGWKGGRGLAPAAGASLVLNPLLVAAWGAFWLIAFFRTRDVHFGNVAAIILMPFLILFIPQLISTCNLFPAPQAYSIAIAAFLLSALIFIKHIQPLKDLLRKRKKNQNVS